jgi:hypothetical protein
LLVQERTTRAPCMIIYDPFSLQIILRCSLIVLKHKLLTQKVNEQKSEYKVADMIFEHVQDCLGVWLRLFFKVFFIPKCIKMMFFLFFKNHFWDQRIKTIQNIKKYILIFSKKKIEFFGNAGWPAFQNAYVHAWTDTETRFKVFAMHWCEHAREKFHQMVNYKMEF